MNYAYSRAALHNLYTLPWTLASRCSLRRKLGHSHYNHQIRGEQQGVSIVVDCTEANAKVLATILKQITSDQNPLHEYVLVAGEAKKLPVLPDNARYVVDRGYFDGPALNLGCLAARYSWMLACSASDFPNQDVISWPLHHLAADKRLVLFGKTGVNRASYVYIRKALFEEVGGLRRQETIDPVSRLVNYALAERCVYWAPAPEDAMLTPVSISFSSEEKKALRKAIHFNKSLLQTKTVGWFGRAQQKYYRLYQIVTLVHWLFVWRIPMRLKLARLRNVTIFIVKLQMRPLALELKHMHNEVLLYGDRHFHVHEQQAMTKEKLAVVRKNPTDVPVFIICFERILALEILVDWLASHGFKKIVFIDNDSTYQPLLDYYEKTPYQVLRLNRNVGHTSPWTLSIVRSLVPNDFYIVTDPDVIPVEECPKDFMKYFIGLHEQFLEYQKVGFGLNIDDLPDHYPLKDSVIEWESQFWKHSVAPEVYEAGVDTTFALYKPFTYNYMLHPSLRTGKPYTARHLPWYANPAEITEEEKYYRFRANSSISSWNTDVLKDRYAKEMGDN
jgi:hypothetical protein